MSTLFIVKLFKRCGPLLIASALFVLPACGGSSGNSSGDGFLGPATPDSTSDSNGDNGAGNESGDESGNGTATATVPPAENDGQGNPAPTSGSRAGTIYDVDIPSPLGDGEMIKGTVFEPSMMAAGETYPLVLYASGFGGVRENSLVSSDPQAVAFKQLVDISQIISAGYGVLTFDHRGHGESGGKIRVMDPDFEGANVIRVVDWAEVNLDWLAYSDDPEPNLMLGSVGASYGGGYQLLLQTVDPKQRLDAMAPLLTWNDLRYSLAQQSVIKDGWVQALADGKEAVFDPFFNEQLELLFETNRTNPKILDTLRYHGVGYHCDGDSVTFNGEGEPLRPAATPPAVNALFVQSSRDVLFNFNEALRSYECYKELGGDVRFRTVQIGHNTIGTLSAFGLTKAPNDPGAMFQTDPSALSATCAGQSVLQETLSFFDRHLKGMTDGDIESRVCLDLEAMDSIFVNEVQTGGNSYAISVGENNGLTDANLVTVGSDESSSRTVLSLYTVPITTTGDVLAGIPLLDVTLTDEDNPNNDDAINTIIFAGIGHRRSAAGGAGAGQWDLVDNQLTPLRGLGDHEIEMVGVLERLSPGDEVGLMLFGKNDNQYNTTGSRSEQPGAGQVRVIGTVEIPLIGNIPPSPAPQ